MLKTKKDFLNKRVMVVGMAKSGVSCSRLLHELGANVVVSDSRGDVPLAGLGFEPQCALGRDPIEFLGGLDAIVMSPGVLVRQPFVEEALRRGVEVLGEVELACRLLEAPIVAITGTNGKTTTTALTGEMFKAGGRVTHVLGNIGVPMCDMALSAQAGDVVVAEIAALQLESADTIRPRAAAFLNLTEDHLDRFVTMDYYFECKAKLFANQQHSDYCVLNADDPIVAPLGANARGSVLYFSRHGEVDSGAFVRDGDIIFRLGGGETRVCPAKDVRIPGAHNLENALAATALAMCMGVGADAVRRALTEFEGVEHRIEFVRRLGGVSFINDSKGTNPDSTMKAIEAMRAPTVLILGGYDKHADFSPLFESFGDKVKAVVALGDTKKQLLETAKNANFGHIHSAGNFEDAVLLAKSLAEDGDVVLLSPACASYDMFANFEERGRVFKKIIQDLEI